MARNTRRMLSTTISVMLKRMFDSKKIEHVQYYQWSAIRTRLSKGVQHTRLHDCRRSLWVDQDVLAHLAADPFAAIRATTRKKRSRSRPPVYAQPHPADIYLGLANLVESELLILVIRSSCRLTRATWPRICGGTRKAELSLCV
ncbi:unnamed protein product, partial [Nesidiocoris tenuis]